MKTTRCYDCEVDITVNGRGAVRFFWVTSPKTGRSLDLPEGYAKKVPHLVRRIEGAHRSRSKTILLDTDELQQVLEQWKQWDRDSRNPDPVWVWRKQMGTI